MIYYIPGLTFQEQIQVWLNSTDGEEYNLGKYLEKWVEVLEESLNSSYKEGHSDGYESGFDEAKELYCSEI